MRTRTFENVFPHTCRSSGNVGGSIRIHSRGSASFGPGLSFGCMLHSGQGVSRFHGIAPPVYARS